MVNALLLLVLAATQAPSEESVAITHVRILTVTKGEIDSGTILVRSEKFVEVGKDVKIPEGARVIEGRGLVAFPGMVNAASRIGAPDTFGSGGAPSPQLAAIDEVNPASDIFTVALRTGMTTYGVHPSGGTIGGQGAILKPIGLQKESMVVDKSAFLRIGFQANTSSKEALRQALDAAKKQIEAEKKNPKPAKSDEKGPPVVRFLKGEIPALVSVVGPEFHL